MPTDRSVCCATARPRARPRRLLRQLLWSGFLVACSAALSHTVLGQLEACLFIVGGYLFFDQAYPPKSLCGASVAIVSMVLYLHALTFNVLEAVAEAKKWAAAAPTDRAAVAKPAHRAKTMSRRAARAPLWSCRRTQGMSTAERESFELALPPERTESERRLDLQYSVVVVVLYTRIQITAGLPVGWHIQ